MVDLVRLVLFQRLQCLAPPSGLPPDRAGRYLDVSHFRQDIRGCSERRLPTQPHHQAGDPFTPVRVPALQLLIQGGKSPLDSGRSSDTAVSIATSPPASPPLSFAALCSRSADRT